MEKQRSRKVIVNLLWSIKTLCQFKNRYFVLMIVESIIKGISPVVGLLLTQHMINNIQLKKGTLQDVAFLLAVLIAFEIVNEICLNLVQLKLSNYEVEFTAYMQANILSKVSELDCKDFENSNTYDLINRTQYDADSGVLGNIKSFFALISLFITTVSYMIIIINYSILIFMVIILVPIVRYYFERKYNLLEYDVVKKNTELERRASYISFLLTNSEYFKEIKIFDLFDFFIEKYKNIKKLCNTDLIQIRNKKTVLFNILGVAELVVEFFVILNIISKAFIGQVLIGRFILYNNSINNLKQNLISAFSCLSVMYKNNAVVDQIRNFFELPPENINADGLKLEEIKEIRLENISYKYRGSDEYSLFNISFKFSPGDFVVLMGYNGSGKSTLIKIVMGIYNDYEGEIYVNNTNRKMIDLSSYRKLVGALFQDYIKYETTISENIWYGNLNYENDLRKIIEMLKKVKLEEQIEQKDSMLGYQFNEGRQLSIGQWQKLALARTLMKDATLYVFDEPNASLDLLSENAVLQSIYEETHNKISIIIMHRFSSVVIKASKIIVLNNGTVEDVGTHEELLKNKGIYYELYTLQNKINERDGGTGS